MKHRVYFSQATPDDEQGLNDLLKNSPMRGDITLSYERKPDFFAAHAIEGDICQSMVARSKKKVVGCFSHAQYKAFVDGIPRSLAYLGQLRSLPAYRNKIRYIKQGFEACRLIQKASPTILTVTSIISNNHVAKRLFNAGVDGLPQYKQLADISTLAIPIKTIKVSSKVRQATLADIPDIITFLNREYTYFQLAPVWTKQDLLSDRTRGLDISDFLLLHQDNQLIGCLSVWDQSPFKQYIIRGYSKKIKSWRWILNIKARVLGGMRFPNIDEEISYAFLSHIAIQEDHIQNMKLLIQAAMSLAKEKGIDLLLLGMDRKRPLFSKIKKLFSHVEYTSTLYSVCWDQPQASLTIQKKYFFHPEIAMM